MQHNEPGPAVITGIGYAGSMGESVDDLVAAVLGGVAYTAWSPSDSWPTTGPRTMGADIEARRGTYGRLSGRLERRSSGPVRTLAHAVDQAWAQSSLGHSEFGSGSTRLAVICGSAYGNAEALFALTDPSARRSGWLVAEAMFNTPSSTIAALYGAAGPVWTTSMSCASGTAALAQAADLLAFDVVDAVIVGACDFPEEPMIREGYRNLRVESAGGVIRAFDSTRDGTLFCNGAAAVVLESRRFAQSRGANPLASLVAAGTGTDPQGYYAGDARPAATATCIRQSLNRYGVAAESIGWVKAHGTGTRANDTAEAAAMDLLFAGRSVPMTSLKGAVGHAGGAAGLVETVAVVELILGGQLPTNVGTADPIPTESVEIVTGLPRAAPEGNVLSLSYGLGGHLAFGVIAPPETWPDR